MAPFYGWGSTVSRLQSHYKQTVYFLSLSFNSTSKSLLKNKLNFSHSVLFHIKTKDCLKYFVNDCSSFFCPTRQVPQADKSP